MHAMEHGVFCRAEAARSSAERTDMELPAHSRTIGSASVRSSISSSQSTVLTTSHERAFYLIFLYRVPYTHSSNIQLLFSTACCC